MKTILSAALSCAVAGLSLAHATGAAAADVGVSVHISQPGVYGRVDIGRFPQPQVVLAQPVIIMRPVVVHQPVYQPPQPVYMWVPPGHRQNWRRHCGQYNACGVPVYFVQDQWYSKHVKGHDRDHGDGKYKDKNKDKGNGKGKGKHDD